MVSSSKINHVQCGLLPRINNNCRKFGIRFVFYFLTKIISRRFCGIIAKTGTKIN